MDTIKFKDRNFNNLVFKTDESGDDMIYEFDYGSDRIVVNNGLRSKSYNVEKLSFADTSVRSVELLIQIMNQYSETNGVTLSEMLQRERGVSAIELTAYAGQINIDL